MSGAYIEPHVSVVIPVYNNIGGIRACLDALHSQTEPQDSFEIIVVDNGSLNPIHDVLLQCSRAIRVIYEPEPGSYAARNAGIRIARGKIIAFTDSDCLPTRSWLSEGLAKLRSLPDGDFVAGAITMTVADGPRPTIWEIYDRALHLRQHYCTTVHGFAATANLIVPKALFDSFGMFRHDLKSKGDIEWCQRARARGAQIAFSEKAEVLHPCRTTLRSLVVKNLRTVGGVRDRYAAQGLLRIIQCEYGEFIRKHKLIISLDSQDCGWRKKGLVIWMLWMFELLRLCELLRLSLGGVAVRS